MTIPRPFGYLVAAVFGLIVFAAASSNHAQDLTPAQAAIQARLIEGRQPSPEFPGNAEWLNTKRSLPLRSLRGKFVLIDFWTYCCINCMHILPELKKLEQQYPNQLVVVGVHSSKFETEKDRKNISEAIMRYEIQHPVLVDGDLQVWTRFGVSSWPTLLLIDPEGNAIWGTRGETTAETVSAVLDVLIPYFRNRNLLDERPVHFELESATLEPTPLRFPGKVLADMANDRIFISDSNHNRIVVASLEGKLLEIFGSGQKGRDDGPAERATFNMPQGMALAGRTLYIADTENHLIRAIDLESRKVTTVAGAGGQARVPFPAPEGTPLSRSRRSSNPRTALLNSPWDLWLHDGWLYIAMAGSHQIWRLNSAHDQLEWYAGNGVEDIVDGRRLPNEPYQTGSSSFAQPSGLSGDSQYLYVADSEGSSIRAVPFNPNDPVKTVVGTADLPYNRLFEFGDRDGPRAGVRLQHPLGVVCDGSRLLVADTYNSKIKVIELPSCETTTLPIRFADDSIAELNEPSGLTLADNRLYIADTNHQRVVVVDLPTSAAREFDIDGLTAPVAPAKKPDFDDAVQLPVSPTVAPLGQPLRINVKMELPFGWKINPAAPERYFVDVVDGNVVDGAKLPQEPIEVSQPSEAFSFELPLAKTGTATIRVSAVFYYCENSPVGLCRSARVRWTIPLKVVDQAEARELNLLYTTDSAGGLR